jgi:transposase, IS30 family
VARLGRPGMSDAQKRQLWARWKAGESISQIARALDKPPGSVFTVLKSNGGYVPPVRKRRAGSLTWADREEISRGLARGDSIRQIARVLGRPASTVSREVARNKGRDRYRAVDAEDRSRDRARRKQPCLLARNPHLRQVVAAKLSQDWSPEQIAGYLARTYPPGSGMRVSHETIDKSLFVQTRGVLAKELTKHLRSGRPTRRNIHNTVTGQWRRRSRTRCRSGSVPPRPRTGPCPATGKVTCPGVGASANRNVVCRMASRIVPGGCNT